MTRDICCCYHCHILLFADQVIVLRECEIDNFKKKKYLKQILKTS